MHICVTQKEQKIDMSVCFLELIHRLHKLVCVHKDAFFVSKKDENVALLFFFIPFLSSPLLSAFLSPYYFRFPPPVSLSSNRSISFLHVVFFHRLFS